METQYGVAINVSVLHYLKVNFFHHKVQEDIFHWHKGDFDLQPFQLGSDKPGDMRNFHFRFEI